MREQGPGWEGQHATRVLTRFLQGDAPGKPGARVGRSSAASGFEIEDVLLAADHRLGKADAYHGVEILALGEGGAVDDDAIVVMLQIRIAGELAPGLHRLEGHGGAGSEIEAVHGQSIPLSDTRFGQTVNLGQMLDKSMSDAGGDRCTLLITSAGPLGGDARMSGTCRATKAGLWDALSGWGMRFCRHSRVGRTPSSGGSDSQVAGTRPWQAVRAAGAAEEKQQGVGEGAWGCSFSRSDSSMAQGL